MSETIVPYAAWAGNIILFGLGIWVIRGYFITTNNTITGLKGSIHGLYDALHKHGHRGLKDNGNDVIRGD